MSIADKIIIRSEWTPDIEINQPLASEKSPGVIQYLKPEILIFGALSPDGYSYAPYGQPKNNYKWYIVLILIIIGFVIFLKGLRRVIK